MSHSCQHAPIAVQIPEYDKAYATACNQVLTILVAIIEPMVGDIPTRSRRHRGPLRNVPGSNPLDHKMMAYQHNLEFTWRSIEETDMEDFQAVMYSVAEEHASLRGQQMFEVIRDVSQRAGMTRSLDGDVLSAKDLIEVCEGIDSSFDEAGNMNPMKLVVNPAQRDLVVSIMESKEFIRDFAKMKARKERTRRDSKRSRKLSRRGI
jgi:hypothetical protein